MTLEDLRSIYNLPLTTLIHRAQLAHHEHHDPAGVQMCQLQSIKTGACKEDCAYCPQSAKYETFVEPERLMDKEEVLAAARRAKSNGASRFCMGASWRDFPTGKQFERALDIVTSVHDEGLEVCCTFGMLTADQATSLRNAGCTVYNHNLDTSPEYYKKIITTRTYDERLSTLKNVRTAGMEVCCGGIVGMGESLDDRLELIKILMEMDPQPESVPINALVAVKGTPLEDQPFIDSIEFVRTIATARIAIPKAMVRLSAGRSQMSEETQTLCFLAGANSLFMGEKLLTTENPDTNEDRALLSKLGLHPLDPDATRKLQGKPTAEQIHGKGLPVNS